MPAVLKTAAHLLLFLAAIVVFYLGLGVGLQVSPLWGTVLWIAAGALLAVNILWLVRSPVTRSLN